MFVAKNDSDYMNITMSTIIKEGRLYKYIVISTINIHKREGLLNQLSQRAGAQPCERFPKTADPKILSAWFNVSTMVTIASGT